MNPCKEINEEEYWGTEDNGTFVKSDFRKKIEQFITKGNDIVEAQRSRNKEHAHKIAKEALRGVYCTLKKHDIDWKDLTLEEFDRLFGVRPIVMAAGLGSRYSQLIHKAVATGGTGRTNIDLAMEGSFQSPTIAPLILVNPKILGLILKGECLEGYQKETGSFIIKDDVLKQIEYEVIDSKFQYIDKDLMRRYLGRDDVLLCYLPVPLGPGGDFLVVVKMLCEKGYESPYVEIAYGEMSPSILPEYTNASLVGYLKILGGNYLSVVGAKSSKGDIEYKGNFALNKGRLAAHEDWERIPHGEHESEQKEFDRVLEQYGESYRIVKDALTEIKKQYDQEILGSAEFIKKIEELREKYPYFVISDEGELFCQERLMEIRDELKNWSQLSNNEREYIKKNYAVGETRTERGEVTANLMISANVGIFKTDIINGFYEELMEEFDRNGYKKYHDVVRKGEPAIDNRRVGTFWGVDWKSGRSKAIVWSFSRIIREWWLAKHPGREAPAGFVDVTGAPSSIKNAERQFKFTDQYLNVYGTREEEKDAHWSEVLEKGKGELERELNSVEDIDEYRKIIHDLFLIGKKSVEKQIMVLDTLKDMEENLGKGNILRKIQNAELIQGIHRNAVVEAIDRGYFTPGLVHMLDDDTAKKVVSYYFYPLYIHPGSGYIKTRIENLFKEALGIVDKTKIESLLRIEKPEKKVETTRDVRPFVREKIKSALETTGRTYFVREGGFASIDINMGIDKAAALADLVKEKSIDLEVSIYFGDEFDLNGNDTPVTKLKKDKNKFCIVSVGPTPPSQEVKGVEWVGGGPEITKGILKRILEGIRAGEKAIKIHVVEENEVKAEIKIDVKALKERGGLIFDVDGTLLRRKESTFYTDKEVLSIFKELLDEGIILGILSGNSRVEQSSRIVRALEEAGSNLDNLVLYANGGATRVVYKGGKEYVVNLAGSIPHKDVEIVKRVAEECVREQFGLSKEELKAWKDFYGAKDGTGRREGFPELDVRWMNKEEWSMDVVRVEDINEGTLKRVSCPWVEIRDDVQVSVKLLPKRLEIPGNTTGDAKESVQ